MCGIVGILSNDESSISRIGQMMTGMKNKESPYPTKNIGYA